MRKEIIIAVLIGLTLGLIITYGFYTAQLNTRNSQGTKKNDLELTPDPTSEVKSETKLKLTSPDNEIVVAVATLTVSGTTSPHSFVTVSLLDETQVAIADDQGNFTFELTLNPGGNQIVVQSLNEDNEVENLNRSVIYDDEKITVATASATAVSPTPKPTTKP
ncbi:MAG TPA: hypothetical protein DEP87_04160 [Candidatus Pacebacteria bacterium]|nr:hypothetical protein [Candidatus Paceibacterota bacterium]